MGVKSHVAVGFSYVAAGRCVEDPLEDGVRTSRGAVTERRYPSLPPKVNPLRNLRVSYKLQTTAHRTQYKIAFAKLISTVSTRRIIDTLLFAWK